MSTISNARWVALSQATRVVSQLVSMTVLARLLAPEAYGLMALAAIVTNLAYLFRDMGTAAAVIQAKDVSPVMASTVHWTNVGLGLAIGVLIVATAPLMAQIFHEPGLANVLYLLALVFPMAGLGVLHQA
ncbi:MAG: oligosaccharide flippase family protein, partial [Oxalobacteraceae bacterium]